MAVEQRKSSDEAMDLAMLSDKATICFSHRIGSKWVQHQNCATGWRSTRSSPRLFILWVLRCTPWFFRFTRMLVWPHVHVAERRMLQILIIYMVLYTVSQFWYIINLLYIYIYWLFGIYKIGIRIFHGRSFRNDPWWSPVPPVVLSFWIDGFLLFCCRGRRRRNTRQGKQFRSRWVKYCIFIFTS